MNRTSVRQDRGQLVASVISAAIVLLVTVAGVTALWMVRDQLPDQIATHWGANGQADGFTSVERIFVMNALLGGLLPLGVVLVGLAMKQGRVMGPLGVGLAVFIGGLSNGAAWMQRGMTPDEVASSDPGWAILISGIAGVIVGVGLWLVFRRRPIPGGVAADVAADAPRLLVDDPVRVAWIGHTAASKVVWVFLGVGIAATAIPAVSSFAAGSWGLGIFCALTAALLTVLGLAMSATVTVGAPGVRVRALGLITWADVPLRDIAGATVTRVNPMRDFGGWGRRLNLRGEHGIITAAGPALRLDRGHGDPLVITVTDAEAAAAAVNTLVSRRSKEHE